MANQPIAYLLEPHNLERLQQLSTSLHNGTDKERDAGHVLWLIIREVRELPLNESTLDHYYD